MRPEEQESFEGAVEVLHSKLDPGNTAVAAQDFRHTMYRASESVTDFILLLECMFLIAYSCDGMSKDTRATLLNCQLRERLGYEVMRAPAVYRATKYQKLCMTARNERKHLADLRRRQQYSKRGALLKKVLPEQPNIAQTVYAKT